MDARSVHLDYALYPPEAITEACEAYRDHVHFERLSESADGESLAMTPVEGTPADTVDEFLSYLLSAAAEAHLLAGL